jgi:hypothetical protein
MTELQRAFFEDLAVIEDQAKGSVREVLAGPEIPVWVEAVDAVATLRAVLTTRDQVDAMAAFVQERVHTALHLALVAIDGASAGAAIGRVYLTDEHGRSLSDDLAQDYVEYLLDTGRMT